MSLVPRQTLLLTFVMASLVAGCGSSEEPERVAKPAPALRLAAETVRVGGAPVAIAVGRDAAWVADNVGAQVRRLDADTGRASGRPAKVGRGPLAIVVGEGGVWVATGAGTVHRIDPATGATDGRAIPVPDPAGIAAGGGSVWVTSRIRGTVTRIDPRTRRVAGPPVRVGRAPADVAVGFGSVWVANADEGTVSRLDSRSGKPRGRPLKVGIAQVLALTVGADAVWVATTDLRRPGRVEILRLDPESGEVGEARVTVPAGVPVDLAAGLGRVWSTDVGSILPGERRGGSVRPIDAPARRVGRAVKVGQEPAGVAVGAGAVWTANAGDGTVTRIAVGR